MRVDIETGTQVPFTAADKVNLLVKALQNQNIGIVAEQRVGANVGATVGNTLRNFTQSQLTQLLSAVSQNSTATVRYLHMAYDIDDQNNTTNFYIGLVTQIGYVPNNGQDLINALVKAYSWFANLNLSFTAYIVGSPPMGTFHYVQDIETKTEKGITEEDLHSSYPNMTDTQILQELKNRFIAKIQGATQQAYSEQGINVSVISAEIVEASLKVQPKWIAGTITSIKEYTFSIKYRLTLDSDFAFQNSPIAPIVLAAIILIAKITAVAVVASISAYLIVEWLKSMTTSTWTSRQEQYGWVLNPNTGEYEWKLTQVKEESGTNPDVGGIGTVGIVLAGLVVVVLFVMGIGRFGGAK